MSETNISIKINGQEKEYPAGTSFLEIARAYQQDYEDDIVLVRFQNNLRELHQRLNYGGELSFVTVAEKAGRSTYRRSASFLMEAAANRLYPDMLLLVQHSIGQGYYCEFYREGRICPVTEQMLADLKAVMTEMVVSDEPIKKRSVGVQDAISLFSGMGRADRVKILKYRRSSRVNIYELGGYFDYYYGYMVPSAGYVRYFDLRLYQNGFMLMFPGDRSRETAEFKPSDKLFGILDESAHWGAEMGVETVGELNEMIAGGRIQDLILIQESWMEQKIGAIAGMIADRKKKIILIAGPSSSGKTTFSHRLSIQLMAHGMRPHPIAMDDFYVNREETPLDEFGQYDFECLEALDIPLFNRTMTDLLHGKETLLPVFNFKTGHREYRSKPLRLGADDVLVIEGIHGLNEKLSYELPKDSKFKIYISALTQINIDAHNNLPTTDGRLLRRIVRDSWSRNTTAQETLARWDSVRRGEERNIFPYQEEADVMFNSALIYELAVLKVYAEPLLFSVPGDCPEHEEAKRLLKFLDYFLPVPGESIGNNSILREFIGGSCFHV